MSRNGADIVPHQDYGLFEPDSVARRVWAYPTTPLHGIVRATVVEEIDPDLLAAVDQTGANYDRLATRYARTVQYFASVAFSDSETIARMADVLVKVHSKAIGTEPISGRPYDANNPSSQLWILITGWHSVLKCYETFGPGRLSDAEVEEYWAACAVAAELQTCDPADVPRTREQVRAYFDSWRPRVAASEAAQRMMHHLLNGALEVLPPQGPLRLARRPANWLIRTGTIATMPHYIRQLAGVHQSPSTDLAVTVLTKVLMNVLNRSLPLQREIVKQIAPKVLPVIEPHWRGIAPVNPVVVSPAQARAELGLLPPAQAHHDLRQKQWQRVFSDGRKPSDVGLIESEDALGRLA
ncbi:MAG: DUF2236 domain-containing protein [Nocardia sp.]|nr:DUF2236 domain-containing protein [Nocardia sp.]